MLLIFISPDNKILYPSMQGKSIIQRKGMLDEAVGNAVLEPAVSTHFQMYHKAVLKTTL